MVPKNVAVVYLKPYEQEEKEVFDLVRNTLDKNKIKYALIERDELKKEKLKDCDLVIVIGGDGTFLRTAHCIEKQPVFGVNCLCKKREGFFLKADLTNFKEKFDLILKNKFRIIKLNRIKAVIGGEETVPALNEIYVGSNKPYGVSVYKIKVRDKEELQKSSGVLVVAAAGSHAWLKSAGGNVLDIESEEIQYFVREPHSGRLTRPSLLMGVVEEGEIEIESMMDCGIVVVDSSSEEYDFKKGKKLRIKKGEPLRFVEFD